MNFQEVLIISSMFAALITLRVGVPLLCTWAAGCVLRRIVHQPEHV